MATLYQTTNTARKVIIFFLIAAIVILVIDLIQRAPRTTSVDTSANRFYMNADNKFGNITSPEIPAISGTRQGATYVLEGVYGLFPDVSYVYSIERPREKLLVFENAQVNIDTLGFDSTIFLDEGEGNYLWNFSDQSKTLSFNKNSQKWGLTTSYEDNVDAIRRKSLTRDLEYYERQTTRLIQTMEFNINGMEAAEIDARYAKLDNGIFTEKTVPAESDYVIIDGFRTLRFADLKPKNQQPTVTNQALIPKEVDAKVFTSDPRIGQLHLVVSENFSNYAKELYEMSFTNFEYSSQKGTYLIITPDEVWNKIQSGQGSLVSLLPQNYNYFADYPQNLGIRRFSADRSKTMIGYYEPSEWTGYLYPIYIFEGRAELSDGRLANFIFFIDAIKR